MQIYIIELGLRYMFFDTVSKETFNDVNELN